jgi:hypothetical protein
LKSKDFSCYPRKDILLKERKTYVEVVETRKAGGRVHRALYAMLKSKGDGNSVIIKDKSVVQKVKWG